MAKKKIGTSKVTNGVARDYFTIPSSLEKGVYQLIAEYSGSASYKPSYDIKKLIIGYNTAIIGLSSYYKVATTGDKKRKLVVSGQLVGYDDSNTPHPLSNRKVGIKLGSIVNKDETLFEQVIDARSLIVDNTTVNTVRTNDNGQFEFDCTIPYTFSEYHYKLLVNYGGDEDYIATVSTSDVYIGNAETYTLLSVRPSYHLRNDANVIFTSIVLFKEDVDSNGKRISGSTRIRRGSVRYYYSFVEPTKAKSSDWHQIGYDDGITTYSVSDTLGDDGVSRFRYKFNYDTDDVKIMYVQARYSGNTNADMGYGASVSRTVRLKIDKDGATASDLIFSLQDFDTTTKALYIPVQQSGKKLVKITSGGKAVAKGSLRSIIYKDIT